MDEHERVPREVSDFGAEVEEIELMQLGHTPLTHGHAYRVDRPRGGSWQQIGIVSEEPATVSAGTFTFDESEEMSITGWQTNVAPKVDMKRLLDQDARPHLKIPATIT